MKAIVEGKEVKVGDIVGFKSDTEQSGQITHIGRTSWRGNTSYMLTLRALGDRGFIGGYIGGDETTTEDAASCWVN